MTKRSEIQALLSLSRRIFPCFTFGCELCGIHFFALDKHLCCCYSFLQGGMSLDRSFQWRLSVSRFVQRQQTLTLREQALGSDPMSRVQLVRLALNPISGRFLTSHQVCVARVMSSCSLPHAKLPEQHIQNILHAHTPHKFVQYINGRS